MTFSISGQEARKAIGASDASWPRWTRGLESTGVRPPRKGPGGAAVKHYRLIDLIFVLRRRRKRGLQGDDLRALMDLDAPFDPKAPCGSKAAMRGLFLKAVLSDDEINRMMEIVSLFSKGLSRAFFDRMSHVPTSVFGVLPMCRPILRYVMLNDSAELPQREPSAT